MPRLTQCMGEKEHQTAECKPAGKHRGICKEDHADRGPEMPKLIEWMVVGHININVLIQHDLLIAILDIIKDEGREHGEEPEPKPAKWR